MTKIEAKQKIIQATQELLDKGDDPEKITVRQIAAKAGVGIGLINYHFDSKDDLLFEAVGSTMGEVAAEWYTPDLHADVPPKKRLRELIIKSGEIGMRYPKLTEVGLRHEMLKGNLSTPQLILPLLREAFPERDEISLRLLAFQVIASMQAAFLQREALKMYLGMDFNNDQERAQVIDTILDNLINSEGELS
jgi:AcrR family transcriptional regulator